MTASLHLLKNSKQQIKQRSALYEVKNLWDKFYS